MSDAVGLVLSTLLASSVEFVEALTIVLAMGTAREWRSTLIGTAAALALLTALTVAFGIALVGRFPQTGLMLVVGALQLIFGLQWLRKAILREAGLKAKHDEDETFRAEIAAARAAGAERRAGLDWFAFVVSFKGVFLEGSEIVFIVITFGLAADDVGLAALGAGIGAVLVLGAGAVLHRPLSQVPENTIKFAVGLLLATFGTFFVVEGLGVFRADDAALEWPGGDAIIPALLALWVAFSAVAVTRLRAVRA
ncbi:MAG TPA: hypothetical protein VFZ89_04595 [Solirubrobacteraceae bacterium]